MAKSTRQGDSYTAHEKSDPTPPVRIRRAMLGEVDKPSVGTGSSQSSESETTSSGKQNQSRQQPAQTTENPSGARPKAEGSTVPSTAGAGHKTEEPKSDKKSSKTTQAKKARARSTDEDDFDFS